MILVILTYLAGVLTILSPCILPVLPFVFSRSQNSVLKSHLPLLLGMILTFSLFSALAIVGGSWISEASEIGRVLAMILLSVFGLSLILPAVTNKILEPLTRIGAKIGSTTKGDSIGGSFVIGISTGLLWAPCAGPILGLVLTGAATQGNVSASIGLLISYSLGAATSLALALAAGNKFLGTLKKFLGVDQVVKKVLGIAVLLGVLAIAFKLDRTLLTQLSKVETVSIENKLLAWLRPEMPNERAKTLSELPELSGATAWLNSSPLTKKDLEGKVVLIDFWTYSCINCLRTLPYVKAWAAKYKSDGLVVIGVHTPEFAFEKSLANVEGAVKDLGVMYPVAVDSDYKIWNAFSNQFWPAHYFIDRHGQIRDRHFGEGDYAGSEKTIRDLLSENGGTLQASEATEITATGAGATASNAEITSPETYIGYNRAQNLVSYPEVAPDQIEDYISGRDLVANEWSLTGAWQIGDERAVAKAAHAKISYRFHARDLHLVLGAQEKIKFKVTLDGHPPGDDHGSDIDGEGAGEVGPRRLYQLIRLKSGKAEEHIFEIEFLAPDVEAYAFTFG